LNTTALEHQEEAHGLKVGPNNWFQI